MLITGTKGDYYHKTVLNKILKEGTLEAIFDHIHIFVDVLQTVAPCDVVKSIKSVSAIELFKAFPQLKQFYARCGVLWSRGYFVSTIDHISETAVIKYIEEQKNDN